MPKADILIVEDNRIVAEDTKITLKKLGFDVSGIVPSGEEVLKKVETEPPGLVLMDIELEGKMDGIEAAARIRDLFNIPVVYVSGYADEDVLERAKVTEPFGYIVKPFEDRELNSAIEIALYKHKMESKLKENEKNLAKAQQISHIGSWKWDIIENKISWTNELYSIFGLSPQKFDVNYDAYLKCIHPDDLESFKKLTQKALRTKKSYNAEYRIIRPNKEIRIVNEIGEIGVDLNDTPISLFGTVQDITERKQIEQKLKYSNLQLEAVFNHLDSIIYITDVDSCEVLYMNDYMKKAFGKDFTGKICWKSFHENQNGPCDFCTNDKLIDTNGNPKEPYIWQFYNQTLNIWYELHDQAIPWTDGRLVRMEIALDITERMQAQEKVNASLKEKVVLLREIHHRVKNNMQVIISLLSLHGRRINDANLSKVFEDCRDRINAMSLIHESLYQSDNLAKIDFKVYLKKLCRNLGQAYGASGKGISLAVGECDVGLDMDQGIAIGMVIAELISNAFKHAFPTGKGGNVSINLSELDAENVKLIIKDDGKGMPPKIDIMNSPSLGLRLAVSAVTLELGGSIEIDRDKGTQFTICFKYKRK